MNNPSTKPNNLSKPFDLTLIKDNPQMQQLFLLALSASKQQSSSTSQVTQDKDKRKFDQVESLVTSVDIGSPSDQDSLSSDTNSDKMNGRPGRKPLTDDQLKQSEMDPKSKRKAQNRAAQRAFRERRVNYVKELEDRIKVLEENQEQSSEKVLEENRKLKQIIQQLQLENAILSGTASSFDIPLSQLTDDNGNDSTQRPQKLLRSIGDDTSATLFSAITTQDSSEKSLSFAPHHSLTSDSSTKSSSLTPSITHDNDTTFISSSIPTDILNSFDTTQQLFNPFNLDSTAVNQGLFDTIPTDTTLISSSISSSSSPSSSSSSSSPATVTHTNINKAEESTTNDLLDQLLVMDDETESPLSTSNNQIQQQQEQPPIEKASSLTQVWDKLAQHPRFDEIDIDTLCSEMKKKACCTDESHYEKLKKTIESSYVNGGSSHII
ncbi:uncharacterized protein BX664DRAFT_343906 [Halteromyces radiatus]|uniref:uncharacterized protein n=1 Tax=Halteromyces radiatus TaxID=101107 RepID=UPI00221F4941|nr:uncharacterized protein BX664DRAFT_343906 [Halteromyces radiatus]KAI8076780.1 hypothetical protein BX664DRAFT_343906 [Halteromyces radiatus]